MEEYVRLLREVNFSFRNSSEFFQRLLTFSFTAPDIARDDDYQKILRRAAQLTKIFGSIKVLDENQKPNKNLESEVDAAKKFSEQCFEGEAGLRSADAELIAYHRKEYFDF